MDAALVPEMLVDGSVGLPLFCRSPRTRRRAGSTPSRPARRRGSSWASALSVHHRRASNPAEHPGRLGVRGAGLHHLDSVCADAWHARGRTQQQAAISVRGRAHTVISACGTKACECRPKAGRRCRTVPRGGRLRNHVSSCLRCAGLSRTPASGTWCARHVFSTGTPSTSAGPVHPFGLRSTIIGHRGRSTSEPV